MNSEDIIYDKIKSPNGTKRAEKRKINDYIEVEFEVITKDGEDIYEIKTITITSSGPPRAKVIVDSKTIVDPNPPVYQDDFCCGLREQIKNNWSPTSIGVIING